MFLINCAQHDNKNKLDTLQKLEIGALCFADCPFIPGPLINYSDKEPSSRSRLISSQELIHANREQLAFGVNSNLGSSASQYNFNVYYGASMHEITYETVDTYGNIAIASGVLWIPWKNGSLPIINFNHGTAVTFNTDWRLTGALFAANGYITIVEDYLGYGKSASISHPYVHAASLSSSTIDLIRAIKKFCKYNGIELNQKLFLTGYSEGANASMSALKEITNSNISDIQVTASAPGSGVYDLSTTAMNIIKPNNVLSGNMPVYVAFLLTSFNKTYNMNRSLNSFFSTNVSSALSNGIFPRNDGFSVAKSLPANTSELLNSQFLSDFAGSGETILKNYISENNTYNFIPKTPVKLFACQSDIDVPTHNTETAYNYFINNGSKNIEKMVGPSSWGGHDECSIPVYKNIIDYFNSF